MRVRRLLAEPMLHFLLIGMSLFAVYKWQAPADSGGHRVVVTQGVIDDLVTQHTAARGREPSDAELTNLIEAYVREEVLYREGISLGLDRDDIVVKRRVRQKIEMMAEEEGSIGTPGDADLAAYLAANPTRFRQPAVLSFEQVYLGESTSGPEVVRAASIARDALHRGQDPDGLGVPSLLPRSVSSSPADLVARDFGDVFVAALDGAPIAEWVGPIESSFGLHYVRVNERTPAVTPELGAVRDQVVREWENERRQRARTAAYARMRAGYDVVIEPRRPAERP